MAGWTPDGSASGALHRVEAFCQRRYVVLAALVLALAAFNLGFRIDREIVTEWDESLYATTAWEALTSGRWLDTTFHGARDYYNTKPPLNVWLIVLSFKAFGVSLTSLRLPSILSAWCCIFALQAWCRRAFGAATALLAAIVLSTSFGFIYVHSARSANADALFTALVLGVVITLWAAERRPARLLWLGPLLAAAFLLKGMAMLMPLAIVFTIQAWRWHASRQAGVRQLLAASVLFAIPTAAWGIARWRLDGRVFFDGLFGYDFLSRTSAPLEGHGGSVLFYAGVLQRDQYEWLGVLVLCILFFHTSLRQLVRQRVRTGAGRQLGMLIAVWGAVTLLVPTAMGTKLPWYIDPVMPMIAVVVAAAVMYALGQSTAPTHRWRAPVIAAAVVVAFGVAEGKLLWYSWHKRDLAASRQGFLLANKDELRGHRVFQQYWNRADWFVAEALVQATPVTASDQVEFSRNSRPGDFLMPAPEADAYPQLVLVAYNWPHGLYRR